MKSFAFKSKFPLKLLLHLKLRFNVLLFAIALVVTLQPNCKCKLEDQINNYNSEPEFLKIAIEPCNFCSEDLAPCWETPSRIDANVAIEVRTAKSDANGNVMPDENVYFEADEDRDNISCSAVNPNNKFTVSVPKRGAYYVRITVRSLKCSMCCWGGEDIKCGTGTAPAPNNKIEYSAGKPKWMVEKIFYDGDKPGGLNGSNTATWTPEIKDYNARKCTCGCKIVK